MEFDFSKFVNDIEKREAKHNNERIQSEDVVRHDQERRLRDARYFEKWQNRIVWEDKSESRNN